MRSELEIRENLEWLSTHCRNYKDSEAASVVNQLATLLWVLGAERDTAQTEADTLWQRSRDYRQQHPSDY
jgi:hypothetical protein